jgi:hypothetical protein
MFSTKKRRQEEADYQAWLARHQLIDDPALRQQIIAAVDRALIEAMPGQVQDEGLRGDGFRHIYARWSWRQDGDTLVQKSVCPDGTDYEVAVDTDTPFEGPSLSATSRPCGAAVVTWVPGLGMDTVEEFLNWFTVETL